MLRLAGLETTLFRGLRREKVALRAASDQLSAISGQLAFSNQPTGPIETVDAGHIICRHGRWVAQHCLIAYGGVVTTEQRSALETVVTIDEEIMHGTACFAGTRVPVQTLIDFLESAESIDAFLAVYPYIPREQVLKFLKALN